MFDVWRRAGCTVTLRDLETAGCGLGEETLLGRSGAAVGIPENEF